jgi:hypothetical protein
VPRDEVVLQSSRCEDRVLRNRDGVVELQNVDKDVEYSFRYFSPSTVQGEPHEFCLEYSDSQGKIMFGGYERGHVSGGMLHFLSPEDWDELYPTRKGQRELIKARLRKYCSSHPSFRHLAHSLRHDTSHRRVHPLIAGLSAWVDLTRVGKVDLTAAVGIALLLLLDVAGTGDPLQFGLWYYLFIPALLIGFGIFLGAPSPYLTGASLAAAVSLLIVWSKANPGGPVATGHLFSLPLAMAGYVIGLISVRAGVRSMPVLVLGCLGWGGGFLLTQMFMCSRGWRKFICAFSIFS